MAMGYESGSMSKRQSSLNQRIRKILVAENYWLDEIEVLSSVALDSDHLLVKLTRSSNLDNIEKRAELERYSSQLVKEGKKRPNSFQSLLVLMDIRKESFIVIRDDSDEYDFSVHSLQGVSESLYGCQSHNSLFKFDLDLDGNNEYFELNANSQMDKTRFPVSPYEYLTLRVFSSKGSFSQIFETTLFETFRMTEIEDLRDGKYSFQTFAKVYLADFDKNSKLDILIWRRHYRFVDERMVKSEDFKYPYIISASYQDGMSFHHELFEHFEESGIGFIPVPVKSSQAIGWLKNNGMSWKTGFPNKSQCGGKYGNNMILGVVKDPILEGAMPEPVDVTPSFDCVNAATTSEQLICKDSELSALDRELSDKYFRLFKKKGINLDHLKTSQREWLRERNTQPCSSNLNCLKDSYQKRLKEFLAW